MGNIANQMAVEFIYKTIDKIKQKKANADKNQEPGRRKKSLVWLNFLYTLYGVEIVYKGFLSVGIMYTLIDTFRIAPASFFIDGKNILSFCAVTLFLLDVVLKFFALTSTRKPEGYTLMLWSLASGGVSTVVYLFFDQPWYVALVFAVIIGLYSWANYVYIRNRKWCYVNPESI